MGMINELKNIMKEADNEKEDLEIIAEGYKQCMRYFHMDSKVPQIKEFKCGNCLWLDTNVGEMKFRDIPDDEISYCAYRVEISILAEDLSASDEEIIAYVNKYLKENW